MNRREVLVAGGLAAVSALAYGKESTPAPVIGGGRGGTTPSVPMMATVCALLPIEFDAPLVGNPIKELQIVKYWASETASRLARWDLDLQVYDQFNLPQWVYAWQLRRSVSGHTMPANGIRMRFPLTARIDMTTTVKEASGSTGVFSVSVPNSTLMVLATARQSTARPPAISDLRFDPNKGRLYPADGSLRDFDALLLRTS